MRFLIHQIYWFGNYIQFANNRQSQSSYRATHTTQNCVACYGGSLSFGRYVLVNLAIQVYSIFTLRFVFANFMHCHLQMLYFLQPFPHFLKQYFLFDQSTYPVGPSLTQSHIIWHISQAYHRHHPILGKLHNLATNDRAA